MATPKQNIPLGISNSEIKGMINDLAKERQKLEKEIEKSLNTIGKASDLNTKRLRELNVAESSLRSELSKGLKPDALRGIRGIRGEQRDLMGVINLLSGRGNIGDIRDLSDVAERAANRLSESGMKKTGKAVGAFSAAAGGVAIVASAAGAIGLTAYAGYMALESLDKWINGDPEKMMEDAQKTRSVMNAIEESKRHLSKDQQIRMIDESKTQPDKVVMELKKKRMDSEELKKFAEAQDAYWKDRKDRTTYQRMQARGFGLASNDQMLNDIAKGEMAVYEERKNQRDAEKSIEMADFDRSAEGARARSLENIRFLQLRKIDEQQWAGVRDWSL